MSRLGIGTNQISKSRCPSAVKMGDLDIEMRKNDNRDAYIRKITASDCVAAKSRDGILISLYQNKHKTLDIHHHNQYHDTENDTIPTENLEVMLFDEGH